MHNWLFTPVNNASLISQKVIFSEIESKAEIVNKIIEINIHTT